MVDLKTGDEPIRVSRKESVPVVERGTSRTEGVGGVSNILYRFSD